MAEARAVINVDVNTSDAAAGLRNLQAQISAFNSTLTKSSAVQSTAMRNSRDNLLELVNASRFFSAETVKMQTGAAALDKTLSKGQATLGQYFRSFKTGSLESARVMSLANTRAAALQTQFVATGAAANGMRDAIAIRPLQAFNDAATVSAQKLAIQRAMLTQATTSMINFGKNTQWAGRQLMVGFTVPLSIFGAMAGKTFMDLEKQIVNFRKVYGDAMTPPEELEQNIAAVKELAKEYTKYGIAVKDTIGLAAEAAAAGAQNKDLLDATTQATRLATLGQMEQNEALDTTISLQNAFKLSGDDLAKSINFLNMVENQTVVTLQDLSAAIPRVAPVIKGLGGNVEDLAAFLAAMQEGGVTAEQGANALKSGLASLINPTERAKETLDGLGISLDSIIQANRGDLMGTVQGFADALDTLDTFSRQQALEQVFGKFQYARLGALFDNINKDGTQAARVLDMVGMSAAEMAASAEKELSAIEESAGTKLTAAMERLQLAIAPIGEMFVKMATPVLGFLASVAEKFNNLPDFAKNFAGLAAVIIGVVIPTGTMFLGLLMNLIGTLVKFGSIVGIAFKGFVSGGFSGAFKAVSQSLRYMSLEEIDAANAAQQLATSTQAVNAAMLGQVGPTELATAAVSELAYAYQVLAQQMQEAALMNDMAFGTGAAAMGAARGPRPQRRNRGGPIVPGVGNTDTVPAMLTPGEFVVNKQATKENMPLLNAINNGSMAGYNLGGGVAKRGRTFYGIRPKINNPRMLSVEQSLRGITQNVSATQASSITGLPPRTLSRYAAATNTPRKGGSGNGPYIYNAETLPLIVQQARAGSQKTHTTPFRSMSAISSSIPGDSERSRFLRLLADAGIPIELLDDAWLNLEFNQALRGNGISGKNLIESLKNSSKTEGFWGPAWKTVNKEKFLRSLEAKVRPNATYTDYGERGGQNFGRLIWEAASESGGLDRKVVGAYVPKVQELESSIDKLNSAYQGLYSFKIRKEESKTFMDVFDAKGNKVFSEMARGSYGFNSGGDVPGTGNRDTVPAMLTPGEFVVNKKATQSNRALLEAINNGDIREYARGGYVDDSVPGRFYIVDPDGSLIRDSRGKPVDFGTKDRAKAALNNYRSRGIAGFPKKMSSRVSGVMSGRGSGMGAGMGMGMLGGAMMMAPMIPGVAENSALTTAATAGGMGLNMLGMLPMLGVGGPVTLAIAGVAAAATAAGVAIYKWRDYVDTASKKAAEFGANIGGTANSLNNISAMMGETTPAQRRSQISISEEDLKIIDENAQAFENIFSSEKGQAFIEELSNATSQERFKKLSDYLKYAIASGLMDNRTAQAFAKGIAANIGDSVLGTQVSRSVSDQESGAAALADLAKARKEEADASAAVAAVKKQEEVSYEQSSQAIGTSLQVIQDYANAQSLAYEQFADGTISYEDYQKVLNDSRDAQSEYTRVIQDAMQKTSDFGGSMQAFKDQLLQLGVTTSQYDDLESVLTTAAEQRASADADLARSSESTGVKLEEAFNWVAMALGISGGSDVAIATPSIQDEKSMAERSVQEIAPVVGAAIAGGVNSAIASEIGAQIISGSGSLAEVYNSLVDEVGAATAFETAALTQQIGQGIGGTSNVPGIAEAQKEYATTIVTDFVSEGGDPVSFQRWLERIPEEKQLTIITQFDNLTPEQQDQMLADSDKLAQLFNDDFSEKLRASEEYQKALAEGSTGSFIRSMEEAKNVFGEATEEIYDEAKRTKQPFKDLVKYGEKLSGMSQEMSYRLGIDPTSIEDLNKFGPLADNLIQQWPILKNLDPEIDMKLYSEFLSVDGEGKELSAAETAERTKRLNKLWDNFKNAKSSSVKKEAVIDLITLRNGEQSKEDIGAAYDELIAEYGQAKIMNLPPDMLYKVVGLKIDMSNVKKAIKEYNDTLDRLGAMVASGNGDGGTSRAMARVRRSLERQKIKLEGIKDEIDTTVEAGQFGSGGATGGGGGGGGDKEKSILEQLKEQLKGLIDVYSATKRFIDSKTGEFKKIAAGPFGPEFIDYLKSQGEEGMKLLNGNMKKLKEVYKEFKAIQIQQGANFAQTFPASILRANKNLQIESKFTEKLLSEGFNEDTASKFIEGIGGAETIRAYNKINEKKKKGKELSKEEEKLLKAINKALKLGGPAAEKLFANQSYEGAKKSLRDMREESETLNKLLSMGYTRDQASDLMSLGVNASFSAEQIRNTANELLYLQAAMADVAELESALAGIRSQQRSNDQEINRLKYEIDLRETVNRDENMQAMYAKWKVSTQERLLEALQRESDIIARNIELAQRELEPIDERIDAIEEEKDTIEESFNSRLEALDEILEIEQEIFDVRKGMLDVADALSQGDIAAAAKAALELQKTMSQQRADDQRAIIEQQRQDQIAIKDEEINRLKNEREAIEKRISNLQADQRRIQDDIYNVNFIINEQAFRLSGLYNLSGNELENLKADLVAATSEQSRLADEARRYAEMLERARAAQGGGGGGGAPAPSGGGGGGGSAPSGPGVTSPGTLQQANIAAGKPVTVADNKAQAWYASGGASQSKVQSVINQAAQGNTSGFTARDWAIIANNIGRPATVMYGGKIQKRMFGGAISYRGSRERAPGFAFGGDVNSGAWVPGNGMLDSVPALLTPGEFVVRKPVAQKYGPLLNAINSNVFPRANFNGAMPKSSADKENEVYNYSINVTLNGSNMNPDDVANVVMQKIKMKESMNVRSYNYRG